MSGPAGHAGPLFFPDLCRNRGHLGDSPEITTPGQMIGDESDGWAVTLVSFPTVCWICALENAS